ncbi:OmpH family outer membrane protein [Thauera mechernichensis]|uniref:OmpH family outer membrane protein n=1 Tax=Thauera mechernichensis TaxID=82788 RepID=A0ABW3WC23_9RHOO|nr:MULTISPECIES: OmpH family outer membrane protein [Thauera]ENO82122.1 outer membrane protein [Thauera sp. 27]ENO92600.1 outer membrane protein [Thauera sp. 28]MDG3065370.1 OmpH family outer membrane protein [Thauera mechernichensis]WBL62554.1 OmpH family outer membrane protein [Thauera sp. WB-2]HNR59520.1 OmpH family outer membrane protein [Thauera sp.]
MRFIPLSLIAAALLGASQAAIAESKIGFVNSDRLMREAAPAVRAQQRLEKEFEKRDQELQRLARDLQSMQEDLERNAPTMSENDRRNKERTFNELNRDFQRKQREFREDLNQRRNEELASVLDQANRTVKQIAESEKYDIILQEAVYASPRIDITDKVIKALSAAK